MKNLTGFAGLVTHYAERYGETSIPRMVRVLKGEEQQLLVEYESGERAIVHRNYFTPRYVRTPNV